MRWSGTSSNNNIQEIDQAEKHDFQKRRQLILVDFLAIDVAASSAALELLKLLKLLLKLQMLRLCFRFCATPAAAAVGYCRRFCHALSAAASPAAIFALLWLTQHPASTHPAHSQALQETLWRSKFAAQQKPPPPPDMQSRNG